MSRRNPEQAIQMLDLLTEFFDGGRRWIRHNFHDDDGNRCLIGALTHLRAVANIRGDGTGYYLREAQPQWRYKPITDFNDQAKSYEEIGALIARARSLAEAERDDRVDGAREHRPAECAQTLTERCAKILKARTVATAEAEERAKLEPAPENVKRWLLAEIERERVLRAAAGDTRPTWISCPRIPPVPLTPHEAKILAMLKEYYAEAAEARRTEAAQGDSRLTEPERLAA
jgi:hypothetical protein